MTNASVALAHATQPVVVAGVVALASALTLVAVARGVLFGPPALFIAMGVASVGVWGFALAAVVRVLYGRWGWRTPAVIVAGVLAIYAALAVSATDRWSVAMLRPELIIAIVAAAAGAASAITIPGWGRIVGGVGLAACVVLLATPALAAL